MTPEQDPFETEEYQRFVESMVPYCRCRSQDRPCDGILAGGLCDDIQDDEREEEYDLTCLRATLSAPSRGVNVETTGKT